MRTREKTRGFAPGDCKTKRTHVLSPKGLAAIDGMAKYFRGYVNKNQLASLALALLQKNVKAQYIRPEERIENVLGL